jgi:hypothetical protein
MDAQRKTKNWLQNITSRKAMDPTYEARETDGSSLTDSVLEKRTVSRQSSQLNGSDDAKNGPGSRFSRGLLDSWIAESDRRSSSASEHLAENIKQSRDGSALKEHLAFK